MALPAAGQVRLELRQETAEAQRAAEKARALMDLYKEPAALAMLKRQTDALKEQARLSADAARERRKVEVGGFAEGLENAQKQLGKVKEALAGIAREAGIAFAVMSAGIGSAVRSASPAHFQTLRDSVSLLGAAVGQAFLPAAKDMAGVLQKAAAWVRSLDEGLKGTIARTVLWVVGLTAAVAIGAKVISLALTLTSVVIGLGQALSSLSTWVSLNPWVLALAGVSAAVIALIGDLKELKEEGKFTGKGTLGLANKIGVGAGGGIGSMFDFSSAFTGGKKPEDQATLLSMGSLMPKPGFHTGAGFGESLQLASLSVEAEGDLAAERHREQLEALEKLLGEGGLLKDIKDNTESIRSMVPAWR